MSEKMKKPPMPPKQLEKKKETTKNNTVEASNVKKNTTTKKMSSTGVKSKGSLGFLKQLGKIEKLPKTVRESIPIEGFFNNGIIETSPGVFTKSYRLNDVNFDIAPEEDQMAIFKYFIDFLNSFDRNCKWQFSIFNHEIDKKTTIENIRIAPQRDGLNIYRQEMNGIYLAALKKGNNSIKKDKFLTVSVEDRNFAHVESTFRRLDTDISKKLRKISGVPTPPMTTIERLKLLYTIYNQEGDYRLETAYPNGTKKIELAYYSKAGLQIKDVIGPQSIEFKSNKFMLGDMHATAMYLKKVPSQLGTDFIQDLSDIQSNMLISITSEGLDPDLSKKLVRNQLAAIETQISSVSKRNAESGYWGQLPPDLERSQQNARDLMDDITKNDQGLFLITITVVVFSRTSEQLDECIKLVKSVASKHQAPIESLKFDQEAAFNTSLPLCRNDIMADRLYTSTSAAVFIPFNAQEISQEHAIYYGLNQATKSMILFNRTDSVNANGLVFGMAGSGKSFISKCEMISVLLKYADAQVFVIDPQGEYYPLTNKLNGEEIVLAPGSNVFINPLDLDISDEDEEMDPITAKSDFVISLFSIILGKGRELLPMHTSIIDKCVRNIYRPYIKELMELGETFLPQRCPTLSDLYQELMAQEQDKEIAQQLASILYQYAIGSFNTFAHRTNVNTNARFVVYNTKRLGTGMKELGLFICTNDVWNKMIANSKKKIRTWFYIDEFHILIESENTTSFLRRVWKMSRKWLGVPTGIMQNTEDLLRDSETRAIINNTPFVIMLNEPLMDRQNLQQLFRLSNAQLEYITDAEPGSGLIYTGKVIVPFKNEFPKNTELYKILTTKHDVEGALFV